MRFALSLIALAAMTGVWAFFWMRCYAEVIMRPFGYKGNWLVFAVYGILLFFFTSFYGGYRIGYYKREDVVYSGVVAMIVCNAVTYLQTCLIGRAVMDAWPFFPMTFLQAFVIIFWAAIGHKWYIRAFPPREILMVYGGGSLAASLLKKMTSHSDKYIVREAVDIDKCEYICAKVLEYENVILCDIHASGRNRLLKFCFEH